jgi:hypothetical protein
VVSSVPELLFSILKRTSILTSSRVLFPMGQLDSIAREVFDDLSTMGPNRLFSYARILLHGQVVFGMIGCLTMVYGTIHPGQVACALFGIVAIDLRHAPLMRSYAWLVTFLLVLDIVWHHFWAERLLRNFTGVQENQEMWWGLMVANTNKVCGFGMELVCGILRLLSIPLWFMLWNGSYLAGHPNGGGVCGVGSSDGYEVPTVVRQGYEMVTAKGPDEY